MKLKYYLRGLGAGILFSVLIFSFVIGPKEKNLSEEEIIEKATKLGMVEATERSIDMDKLRATSSKDNLTVTPEPTLTPSQTPAPTQAPSPTKAPTPTQTPSLTSSPSPTATPSPSPTLTPSPTPSPSPSPSPTATPSPSPTATPSPTLSPSPTATPSSTPSPSPTAAPTIEPKEDEKTTITIQIKKGMTSEQVSTIIREAGLIDSAMQFNDYLIRNGYAELLRIGSFTLEQNMSYKQIAKILTTVQ